MDERDDPMTGAPVLRLIRRLGPPDVADEPETDLLERFVRRRDGEAFAVLVRRHGPMVLGVCRRVLRNAADAEDAFQATFLVLARKAGAIGRRERLAGWLFGVACRTARKARSAAARREAVLRACPGPNSPTAPT